MVQEPCDYCGLVPSPGAWNGIDRLESSDGYHEGNTVPCCTPCNSAKSTMYPDVFVEKCAEFLENRRRAVAQTSM